MSIDRFRSYYKRLAPIALGIAVLGSLGVGIAEHYARACCAPGSPCCHPGSPCCHGHSPSA